MPNLSNLTAGGLVDLCAPGQEEFNRLKKLTEYYKVGLKARLTEEMRIDPYSYLVRGENYSATITTSNQERLDMNKVRALLTEEQIESCTVSSEVQTIRFYKEEKAEA